MATSAKGKLVWIDKQLTIQRIDQKKKWFCGPACAEMVLSYFGVKIDQAIAYQEIHSADRFEEERLYSDPKGLVEYINRVNDQSAMVDIFDINETDQKVVLDWLYSVLFAAEAPVPMLALGGDHWVVVSGVRYLDSLDGPRQYAGFYIENPWKGSTPSAWIEISEFLGRWIRPNKFGRMWLNKLVILANRESFGGQKNGVLQSSTYRVSSSSGSRLVDTISMMARVGFQNISEISGGGALVLKPVRVLNEDSGEYFWIVPLDATENKEFSDFVYVCTDDAGERVFEVSRVSDQLDIPSIEDAEKIVSAHSPGSSWKVDNEVYWRGRNGGVSRTDVYRKIQVDDKELYLLRSGELYPFLDDQPLYGG